MKGGGGGRDAVKKRKHSDTKDTCRAQCMNKNKSESRKGKKERKEERKRNAPHLGFGEGMHSFQEVTVALKGEPALLARQQRVVCLEHPARSLATLQARHKAVSKRRAQCAKRGVNKVNNAESNEAGARKASNLEEDTPCSRRTAKPCHQRSISSAESPVQQ